MQVTFNPEPVRLGARLPAPEPRDLETPCFRHGEWEFVRARSSDYVRAVLDRVPLAGAHRWVGVDVDVSWVDAGRAPGLGWWHVDTFGGAWPAGRPEVYHLFVGGDACLPEFLDAPFIAEVDPALPADVIMRALDREVRRQAPAHSRVPACRLSSYGRLHVHRASVARRSGLRFRIRVAETDARRPTFHTVPPRQPSPG